MVEESKCDSYQHQYFCFDDVFYRFFGLLSFSNGIKEDIIFDKNISLNDDDDENQIDSSIDSLKENLIVDDEYLNYDNTKNYNNGVNKTYKYIISDDVDNIKSHTSSSHVVADDDNDNDDDDDDDDNGQEVKTCEDKKSDTSEENNVNPYIIRPDGWLKKLWEIIGLILLLWQLYDVVTGRYHHWLVHPIMDAYFIFDILLRFRTGYIDNNKRLITYPDKIRRRYLRGSFFIDLIISLPYGFLSDIWKNRPITKLVEIKNRIQEQPKHNLLLTLIFNKPFRLEVIRTIKDHLFERKYYKAFREVTGIGLTIMPDRQKKPIQWIIRRTARILGFGFRVANTFKVIAYYSIIAKHIQGIAFSARSVIVLWPVLREKIRPILFIKRLKRQLMKTRVE